VYIPLLHTLRYTRCICSLPYPGIPWGICLPAVHWCVQWCICLPYASHGGYASLMPPMVGMPPWCV